MYTLPLLAHTLSCFRQILAKKRTKRVENRNRKSYHTRLPACAAYSGVFDTILGRRVYHTPTPLTGVSAKIDALGNTHPVALISVAWHRILYFLENRLQENRTQEIFRFTQLSIFPFEKNPFNLEPFHKQCAVLQTLFVEKKTYMEMMH